MHPMRWKFSSDEREHAIGGTIRPYYSIISRRLSIGRFELTASFVHCYTGGLRLITEV
jgi:hypothetical protein